MILPVLREGEVVKRAQVRSVRAEELSDFRAGVVVMEGHVVCFFYDGDGGFRVYDNATRKSAKKDAHAACEWMNR